MTDYMWLEAARTALQVDPTLTRKELHKLLAPEEPLPEGQDVFSRVHRRLTRGADRTTGEYSLMIEQHLQAIKARHADATALELKLMSDELRSKSSDTSLSNLVRETALAESQLFSDMARESTTQPYDARAYVEQLRADGDVLAAEALERTLGMKGHNDRVESLQLEISALEALPAGLVRDSKLAKAKTALESAKPPADALTARFDKAADLKRQASEANEAGDREKSEELQRQQFAIERGVL